MNITLNLKGCRPIIHAGLELITVLIGSYNLGKNLIKGSGIGHHGLVECREHKKRGCGFLVQSGNLVWFCHQNMHVSLCEDKLNSWPSAPPYKKWPAMLKNGSSTNIIIIIMIIITTP